VNVYLILFFKNELKANGKSTRTLPALKPQRSMTALCSGYSNAMKETHGNYVRFGRLVQELFAKEFRLPYSDYFGGLYRFHNRIFHVSKFLRRGSYLNNKLNLDLIAYI